MSGTLPPGRSARGADYWSRTRQPLPCLAFLAVPLLFYEAGTAWCGGAADGSVRTGADFWMRVGLQQAGFSTAWLLPVGLVGGLLAWHAWGRFSWRLSYDTLLGMLAESLIFACCLIIIGQLQELAFRGCALVACDAGAFAESAGLARVVSFVGAGVYEEMLFRLCLLPLAFGGLCWLRVRRRVAMATAICLTSLAFAGAHYVGPAADAFLWFSFVFRFGAGLYFAALFWLRGIGIAAGCHIAYDLLVGVVLTSA